MIKKKEFINNLEQFTGTFQYHKITLFPLLATDGVAYFAKAAEAYWMIDEIGAFVTTSKERFIVIYVESTGKKAIIKYDDGNGNILGKKKIDYTNLIEGDWTFYVSNHPLQRVIMLPMEY